MENTTNKTELFLVGSAVLITYDKEGVLYIDKTHRSDVPLSLLAVANRQLRAKLLMDGIAPLEEIKVLSQIDEIRNKSNINKDPFPLQSDVNV